MSGFFSYVLEQRITFDATPISLDGPATDWTPVQTDDTHDANNDSQSANGETDLVGNATHSLLYAKFDDKGTASESDDEIGFRLRIGATDSGGGFGGIAAVGTDANADGTIDLFLAFDGRGTPTVNFFEPGPGSNDSPLTTSLQNATAAAGADSDVSLVDAATDPSATDTDLNGDGNTDAFVSFKVLFSDFQNQLNNASGLTVTKDSPLQFAAFTLTQENAIDGDIGGIDGGNAATETFTDLGVFSKAASPVELSGTGATPAPASNEAPRISNFFSAPAAFLQVFENTIVAEDIDATDADGDPITFSIVGGADAALFNIDPDSGVLSFNTAPDFETPTDSGGNNQYDVNVAATDDSGASDTQSQRIIVRDLTDFLSIDSDGGGDTATLDVEENSTLVTTVSAFNEDTDAITFSIAGGADSARFSIDETTGALAFIAAPDFESPDSADGDNEYTVLVRAADAGGLTDSQTITVRVTNINDAPVITSNGGGNAATVNAAENQTAVTTVTADDDDGDTVNFSITGGEDAARFSIDSNSGALTFLAAPDFETPGDADGDNQFVVTVQASDGSGATDTQTITVNVTDANDAPSITSDGGGANAALNVAEETTAVTTVTADDVDGDTVSFAITGGDDAAQFSIDPNSGALTFLTAPDFENPADANGDNDYQVVVQASDGRGGVDTQILAVTVTDANDSPVITSSGGGANAGVNAAENTTEVATVVAGDQNGDVVTFSIAGGADAARFEIDPDSGVLRFLAPPDFENPADANGDNDYQVVVQASDGLGGADTQTITVTVTNVNEAPAITSDGGGIAAAIDVAENIAALTTVAASDVDGDPVTYSITGGADAGQFDIDTATGVLSFISAPDFETPGDADGDNIYVVTVQASDGAGGVTTQTISATVKNANDAPIITNNTGTPAPVAVAENGTAVTTVAATDADGNPVGFSIIGGPDAALFQIDAVTGVLTFNTAPDFEAPDDANSDNSYTVTVQASDGAGGTDTQTLTVTVTDIDETVVVAPVITPDPPPNRRLWSAHRHRIRGSVFWRRRQRYKPGYQWVV